MPDIIHQRPALRHILKPAPVAVVLVVLFAAIIASNHIVDFWIYCTSPLNGDRSRVNFLIGYSFILDGRIFHQENLPFLEILNSFLVSPPAATIYAVRPVYPLLASVIAPFTGAMPALLLVNVAAWAAAAYCAARLASLITDSPLAPWIAGAFVLFGQGYWFHLTDYSAHMLSNCGYVVAVYVLARLGVADRRLELQDQIVAAATIVAMALTYNTGLALLLAYMLFSGLSGAWRASIVTAVLVLAEQRIWPFFYGLSSAFGRQLQETESSYLSDAIARWWILAHDPLLFLRTLGWIAFQVVACDPLTFAVVLLSAAGVLTGLVKRRLYWFLFVAGVAPIALALPWMSFAVGRGYLANAGYGVLAVLAAAVLGRFAKTAKFVVVVLIVVQGAWLASESLGNAYTAKIFSVGAHSLTELSLAFGSGDASTASLTGYESAPQLVGGGEVVNKAGGADVTQDFAPGSIRVHGLGGMLHAWAYRFYVFAPLAIAILFSVRRRRAVAVLIAAAYLLPPIVAKARVPERFALAIGQTYVPEPVKSITQEVKLSEQALRALRSSSSGRDRIQLFSGILARTSLEVDLCGQRILDTVQSVYGTEDPFALVRVHDIDRGALELAARAENCDRVLRVSFRSQDPAGITRWMAWQRVGLPSRRLTIDGLEVAGGAAVSWPALELRIGPTIGPEGQLQTKFLFF